MGRRILLGLLALLVLLAAAGTLLSQTEAVRQRALGWTQRFLSDSLGREVRIQAIRLKPWLGKVELADLRIAALPGEPGPSLFAVDHVHARWNWIPILRRHLELRYIELERPRLALAATGTPELPIQDLVPIILQAHPLAAAGWTLGLERASIREGRLTWTGAGDTRGALEGLDGDLAWWRTPEGMATAAATVGARRLQIARGDGERTFEAIRLRLDARPGLIELQELAFGTEGAVLGARGRLRAIPRAPQVDLTLTARSPLAPVLQALGLTRRLEGSLALDGRLQGSLERPTFQGEGMLQPTLRGRPGAPIPFALRWDGRQLEGDLLEPAKARGRPLGTHAVFVPETGAFRVQAQLAQVDLRALSGLPAVLASLAGISLPAELRGRVTADVDLAGVGTDVAALRGRADVRAEGLALEGDTPVGRLEARVVADATTVAVPTLSLLVPGGTIQASGRVRVEDGSLDLPVRAELQQVAGVAGGFGVTGLEGQASLAGRIQGTLGAPRFRGRVRWQDARIAGRSLGAVEGEIEVTRRRLASERLTLRTGRTRVNLRGSVAAEGTASLRALDLKRDLSLDLQVQIDPGRVVDLLALLPPEQAQEIEVQGGLRASGRLRGPLGRLSGSADLALENARTGKEHWDRAEAQIRLESGAVDIGRIVLRRGGERLSGEVHLAADGSLQGRLGSTPMDLARVGTLAKTGLAGRATFRIEIGGTTAQTRIVGQASSPAASFKGIGIGAASASFRFEQQRIHLDLTCLEETLRFQATIGPPPASLLEGDITLTETDLDPLLRFVKVDELRRFRPTGSGLVRIREKPEQPNRFRGEIDLSALRLGEAGVAWESAGPVQVRFDEPRFTVSAARLRSGGNEIEIQGGGDGDTVDLGLRGQLPFQAVTPYIGGVGQPLDGVADADLRLRGPLAAAETSGTLTVQKGRFLLEGYPTEFQEVQARIGLDGPRTHLQDIQARVGEGNFHGSGELHVVDGRWDLQLNVQEERGQLQQLLAGLYRGRGEVTGDGNLSGTLTSRGEARGDFWANLGGHLRLELRDGRIGRYTAVAKMLSIMNLAHLLGGSANLSARGMPYTRLTADFAITQGVARTQNLVLESPAMKLTAVGSINLAAETVDMAVAVRPFQNVDLLVTSIPIAGWLLGGKEKSLVVAYFTAKGPLADPDVEAAPWRSMGRNVFGIFTNILGIPEALVNSFQNLPPQEVKPNEGKR